MITAIAEKVSLTFAKSGIIEEQKQDLMRYGLEIIISTLIGTLIIIILGVLLKSILFSLIFIAVLVPLRQYTGGYHADTYLFCNISLIITYLFTYYACKVIPQNFYSWFSLGAILLAIICEILFAPIDSQNKRLTEKKKKEFKIKGLIITTICSVVCLLLLLLRNKASVMVSMTLLSVTILLIIGKIKNWRGKNEG